MSTDLRTDSAAFARKVLGIDLWPRQIEAATSGRFVTAIAAARRTGKTTLAEVLAIHTAFAHRDSKVIPLGDAGRGPPPHRVDRAASRALEAHPRRGDRRLRDSGPAN